MRKHLALLLVSICLAFSSKAQTVSLSTNNVVINIASFGINPANVSSVTVKGQSWMVDGHIFRPNDPQSISRATYPQLTNGSVIFSNQICGVAYQLTIATFWSNYTTNYLIPAMGAITNADGSINAALYVGQYASPTAFYYAYINGFQFATNYTTIYTTNTVNNTNSFSITNNLSGTNVSVLNTNDTKFTLSGTTIFGPTNFDIGGAAAVSSNGVVSQFIALTNKLAHTNDQWWDISGTAQASTNKLVSTNDTTWFDPKNAAKQSTNDLAIFAAANYASFTALMATDAAVRLTIIASNASEITRVTAQIGATNTLIHSDIGSTNAVEVTRVTAQIASTNTLIHADIASASASVQTYATGVSNNVVAEHTYAVGVSNNVVASSNANASALSASSTAISNRNTYAESKYGCNTNFILTAGGTGADSAANGTNVFQSPTSWTNLTGSSYITNDAAGSRIYILGTAACGATIGYPVGGAFTNINGTGTPPTTSFFPAGTAAGANMTKTSAFGVDTFASTGGSGGTATNVNMTPGQNVTIVTNATASFTINATNQTFLTNGILDAAKAFSQTNPIPYSTITNPPAIPSTNGFAGTNFVNSSVATVGANGTNNDMVVSNAVYQAGTNAANAIAALASKNATNGMTTLVYTNPAAVVYQSGQFTNGTIQGGFLLANNPFITIGTNVVGMTNNGNAGANGTYFFNGSFLTNQQLNGYAIGFSSPNYLLLSNGVPLQTSVGLNQSVWSVVSGSAQAGGTYIGATINVTGLHPVGIMDFGTNGTAQINSISTKNAGTVYSNNSAGYQTAADVGNYVGSDNLSLGNHVGFGDAPYFIINDIYWDNQGNNNLWQWSFNASPQLALVLNHQTLIEFSSTGISFDVPITQLQLTNSLLLLDIAATNRAALTTATNLTSAERAALIATNTLIHADIASTNVANLVITTNLINGVLTTATNLANTAQTNAMNVATAVQTYATGVSNNVVTLGSNLTNNIGATSNVLAQATTAATNNYASTVTNIANSLIAAQTLTSSTVLTNQTIAGVPTRTNWDGKFQMNGFGFTNVNGVYLKNAANIWTNNLYNGAFVQSNGVTWTCYTNTTSLALYTSSDGQTWIVNNGQAPAGTSRIGTLEDFNLTADAVTNLPLTALASGILQTNISIKTSVIDSAKPGIVTNNSTGTVLQGLTIADNSTGNIADFNNRAMYYVSGGLERVCFDWSNLQLKRAPSFTPSTVMDWHFLNLFGNWTVDSMTGAFLGDASGLTNVSPLAIISGNLISTVTNTAPLNPALIISNGTYIPNGVLATNSGATSGAFLTETGGNRAYSYNASALTNLLSSDGNVVSSLIQATNAAATKALQATNNLSTGAFTSVGNAAVGNTNLMKVFASTNADNATGVGTAVMTNDSRSVVLTNSANTFSGTRRGSFTNIPFAGFTNTYLAGLNSGSNYVNGILTRIDYTNGTQEFVKNVTNDSPVVMNSTLKVIGVSTLGGDTIGLGNYSGAANTANFATSSSSSGISTNVIDCQCVNDSSQGSIAAFQNGTTSVAATGIDPFAYPPYLLATGNLPPTVTNTAPLNPINITSLLATNTLSVTSSGLTNNTTDTYLFTVTAGTGLSLKDGNGNGIFTPILNESIVLKPTWRFTGTAVTASTAQIINR